MCTLIHNILTTDFIALINDDESVRGLKIIHDGTDVLVRHGVDKKVAEEMRELFGVSGICNILGAIKMAKHLRLGPGDNVVTIATDGYDRYESVLELLEKRELETADYVMERWYKDIFLGARDEHIEDARLPKVKERLFKQKESDWLKFGYSQAYLDAMRKPDFWEIEYNKVHEYDEKIKKMRGKTL
jgi:hypothetical protein